MSRDTCGADPGDPGFPGLQQLHVWTPEGGSLQSHHRNLVLTGENQAASKRSDFRDEEKRLLKCIRHVSADASQREEKQFLYDVTQQFTRGINEARRSSVSRETKRKAEDAGGGNLGDDVPSASSAPADLSAGIRTNIHHFHAELFTYIPASSARAGRWKRALHHP